MPAGGSVVLTSTSKWFLHKRHYRDAMFLLWLLLLLSWPSQNHFLVNIIMVSICFYWPNNLVRRFFHFTFNILLMAFTWSQQHIHKQFATFLLLHYSVIRHHYFKWLFTMLHWSRFAAIETNLIMEQIKSVWEGFQHTDAPSTKCALQLKWWNFKLKNV